MSTTIELAGQILDHIGDRAEAEVLVTGGDSALTRFANSFIHQNVAEEGHEVMLRVAVDGRVNSATTTNIEGVAQFVDDTIEIASLQRVDEGWPGVTEPMDVIDPHHFDEATAQASPDERAATVARFVEAAPELRAAGYCETLGHEVAFVNTAGHRTFGNYTRATVDGIHQADGVAGSGGVPGCSRP
jgi:predicted Zn-dependent protease